MKELALYYESYNDYRIRSEDLYKLCPHGD